MRLSARDQRRPSGQPGDGESPRRRRLRHGRGGRQDDLGGGGGLVPGAASGRTQKTDGTRVTMSGEGTGSGEMQSRIIDVPIESLPFIDEHYIEIAAKPDEVWDALIRAVSHMAEGRRGRPISRALGCEETQA